jgi:hypothetical protein
MLGIAELRPQFDNSCLFPLPKPLPKPLTAALDPYYALSPRQDNSAI